MPGYRFAGIARAGWFKAALRSQLRRHDFLVRDDEPQCYLAHLSSYPLDKGGRGVGGWGKHQLLADQGRDPGFLEALMVEFQCRPFGEDDDVIVLHKALVRVSH